MRVIVAGGRDFIATDYDWSLLRVCLIRMQATEVVSGCARGADTFGERVALRMGIPVTQFPADWSTHGKKAGIIRNKEMAEYADAVVLFPGGKGTANMRQQAITHGLKILDLRNIKR